MTYLRGWRTIVLNALFTIVPILELTEIRDVLPPHWQPWYALAVVLANMWLRYLTTTPVGKK